MKSIEKPLMFAVAAMALLGAVAVMAISTADQAQASKLTVYKFKIKVDLLPTSKLIHKHAALKVQLFDDHAKVRAHESKAIVLRAGVYYPIEIDVPLDVAAHIYFAKVCIAVPDGAIVKCVKIPEVSSVTVNRVTLDLTKIGI
jgi:hypothetical protein